MDALPSILGEIRIWQTLSAKLRKNGIKGEVFTNE
jgi:hypothetical protein